MVAVSLKPEAIKRPLKACGYRHDLLRPDFALANGMNIPLVGFAQIPMDSRSACVAVVNADRDPRFLVEECRPLGAPVVFACFNNTLQWWRQGIQSAEWIESVPADHLDRFFDIHKDQFSPEAVYRAKTLGRVCREFQLSFVDMGLMPVIEKEVGKSLGQLIERNVATIKSRLGWSNVSDADGHWLLKSVFWLLSGKILRDKDVPGFEDIDLTEVDDVFSSVAGHYGTEPFTAGSKQKLAALQESAAAIGRFSSLALTTTESLAYVYENTLISDETRASLGTHSTPSYLVDYIVSSLADWISEIPENDRQVFEPACGHAAFLVSAMRLLTQLLPPEKSIPSRRGPYLRNRLHGTERDPFALELARLSLTLTDIPNPDGWDLRVQDMFLNGRLAEQTRGKTILLANPPFENFSGDELAEYKAAGAGIIVNNKATEMLRRTLPMLRPGSVFGLVVPQTLLHGAFAADVRRLLVEDFELREVSLFPDNVFSFSQAESAVLLGRRISEKSKRPTTFTFRRFRGPQVAAFRESYAAPNSRTVEQSRFNRSTRWELRVPDLEEVWLALANNPIAADVADFGTGLVYHGKRLPPGVPTYSENRFPGSHRGYIRLGRGLQLHSLPKLYWMNLADEALLWKRSGVAMNIPQVLMSYGRTSKEGPWRLKAFIDRKGLPVASRFLTVRPKQLSLDVLWALLNSPVANAYAFTHLTKRDNIPADMRKIPMPLEVNVSEIESVASEYLKAAAAQADPVELRLLMLRLDAAVLRQYALPIELEWAVLSLFTNYDRVGVPFTQNRYFPEEFESPIRLSRFLDYESNWPNANRRRGHLIDKEIAGTLSESEAEEFSGLQEYADYHLEKTSPRSTKLLEELEQQILDVTVPHKG